MRQFGRRYQLVIGSASDGIAFDNLRVSFEITKTLDKQPNPGKISIYNLNRDHRGAVLSGQYKTVALSVGYEVLRLIYAGDVTRANVESQGMDKLTELECGDGNVAFTSARVNMTLPPGTTDAQAAVALAGTLPNTSRGTMVVTRTGGSGRSKVYCGNTRDHLSNLAHANNADWSIQDGQLVMLPSNAALAGEGALISDETGMIGGPKQTDNGLEVKCLLNPEILVGGVVRIVSIESTYSGDYKVVSVKHTGDSLEGDWTSDLTCIGGKFQKVEKKKKDGTTIDGIDGDGGDVMSRRRQVSSFGARLERRPPGDAGLWSVDDLI